MTCLRLVLGSVVGVERVVARVLAEGVEHEPVGGEVDRQGDALHGQVEPLLGLRARVRVGVRVSVRVRVRVRVGVGAGVRVSVRVTTEEEEP